MMNAVQRQLRLLQLADSSFPSGAFTQSFGLETFIQSGAVSRPEHLAEFMATYLFYTWRPTDLLTVKLSYEQAFDKARLERLDRRLHAMKLPKEGREGSMKMGKRLKQLIYEFDASYNPPLLPFGQHAVVLGHYGAGAGIELSALLTAFSHMTVVSLVANGVRAIPIGQTSGQQVIAKLQPLMEECVLWTISASERELGGSAPAFDWAGMAHETLYSRIFMS